MTIRWLHSTRLLHRCGMHSLSTSDARVKYPFLNLTSKFGTCSQKNTTVSEVVNKWKNHFRKCGISRSEAESSSELIIAHVLGKKTLHGFPRHQLLSKEVVQKIDQLCEKRLQRLPVQYVIEEWDFRSLTLKMRPPVFIPRPETEELVDLVYEDLKSADRPHQHVSILDIGSGSGAIILSLLDLLPRTRGVAVDVSKEACDLTKENAAIFGVLDRLTVQHCALGRNREDWLQLSRLHGQFDVVVSNPPYIPVCNQVDMEPEITRFEDHVALFSGEDGLEFVRTILMHSHVLLKPSGSLWLEVDISHPYLIKGILDDDHDHLIFHRTYQDFTNRQRFCHILKKPG